jgi:phosphoribosyl 1,2-cyclic phosphodiesterase
MRFASLGSGSQGNATLVSTEETLILVDCGFPRRETERRLARLNVAAQDIDAVIVTHEHGDHSGGVASFSRHYKTPVYLTHGTASSGRLSGAFRQILINAGDDFTIGSVHVLAVPVPHDAREPVQFRFEASGKALGLLTDLGSITPHLVAAFSGCDALLLEFNHDLDLLMQGAYPAALKQRVAGDFGHLNNVQAGELLKRLDNHRLKVLVAGHLSLKNNSRQHALAALAGVAEHHQAEVHLACQDSGFDWLSVSGEADAPTADAASA